MELKRKTLAKLLLVLISLAVFSGCASIRPVILHPIEKSDIFRIEKGTKCGETIAEKDGWFVSDYYVEEVMRAKVEE